MRFSKDLMVDPKVQESKIGTYANRSNRNVWAEQHESMIRELAPFPISYDVSQGQPTNFSEYTYTEFIGGIWVATQSLELNCILMQEASMVECKDFTKKEKEYVEILKDKYTLNTCSSIYDKVCFLPGHNLLDVASVELTSRLAHEEDDVVFKPHPITNAEAIKLIANRVGWNKIVSKDISGMQILATASEVYTTSASEMSITGTLLRKNIFNVSNFFNEGSGVYHPISRILFYYCKRYGNIAALQALINILECDFSGIILPTHSNIEDRVSKYYKKSIELRSKYKPLAAPRGGKK